MADGVETNKFKLFNDPIYGFIAIPSERIFDLIEHPSFQRLRRIGQLGLSSLEHTLVNGVSHEELSKMLMQQLNAEMDGALTEAIAIFNNQHPKRFLHQLISSQLDMDRMDYLRRDAFYTGVVEGAINSERLLSMLNVADGELVLDGKGISSIEKFLVSRSLMYWQVYMHKAVLSAEYMLVQVLRRAHELVQRGDSLFGGAELQLFLKHRPTLAHFQEDPGYLAAFTRLDDSDILGAMKQWTTHADPVLSQLSQRLLNRRLFRIKFLKEPLSGDQRSRLEARIAEEFGHAAEDCRHFVLEGLASNATYKSDKQEIKILKKSGKQGAYAKHLCECKAAAVIVNLKQERPEGFEGSLLRVANPYEAWSRALDIYGTHTGWGSEAIDPSADLHPSVQLAPGVTIGAGVKIGAGTVLHPGVTIYPHSTIGAHCILHAGVVIGADGFGFAPPSKAQDGLQKIKHIGHVVLGDHVEIGANSCVDRAVVGATAIGHGTKLDNLCQIGHNVQIGMHCVLAGQVGIAGSTTIGHGVQIGGQVGIAGHLKIG
ncbi:MAG: UDP-3-O-(3-hydroxymyristoyl)glucosamine N-acyltransferase, partial [Flavobacteriia bacterium]|nr:UDP-3-O-(3-hydroxymyristoyl)glucosamine N-acyltransferase [Flavobacteriia bacterium]